MSDKPPWWQTTKTARQGLWLGCGFIVVGSGELVLTVTGQTSPWMLIISAGFLAIGLAHLGSSVAMRYRLRSSFHQDGQPTIRDSTPPTS